MSDAERLELEAQAVANDPLARQLEARRSPLHVSLPWPADACDNEPFEDSTLEERNRVRAASLCVPKTPRFDAERQELGWPLRPPVGVVANRLVLGKRLPLRAAVMLRTTRVRVRGTSRAVGTSRVARRVRSSARGPDREPPPPPRALVRRGRRWVA